MRKRAQRPGRARLHLLAKSIFRIKGGAVAARGIHARSERS
jgi:hypothetical protein